MPKKTLSVIEISSLVLLFVFVLAYIFSRESAFDLFFKKNSQTAVASSDEMFIQKVIPEKGIILPVQWGDLGARMVREGVIDRAKIEALYETRGGLSSEEQALIFSEKNSRITIRKDNAGFLLNLFWALGLGTKNDILEKGPMNDPQYGGAGNFASTGGWTLAHGDAMDHYSKHTFIALTLQQQALVEQVSKNIYRPCCNNPTYFPDCNHGMAMLGLLELMASQGVSEEEMYKVALQVNSYWFPDTYITIAKYLELKGIEWGGADPKELLGANYSSASGYQEILAKVTPPDVKSGGGCGVYGSGFLRSSAYEHIKWYKIRRV